MAALGSYTTTEAVRGCLGLDPNDLPDAYMVDSLLDVELSLDLDGWLPSHATLFASGTDAVKNRIRLYAQWFCAWKMAKRPYAVPQITTDGKAQIDRFKIDWVKVAELAAGEMSLIKGQLDEIVNGNTAPTGVISYIGIGAPGQDPVTEGLQ